MPQEFNVLCCYSCMKYQVHQLKKSNKWTCKVCGSKQSITKVYCTASPRDCREIVQKLNMLRGEKVLKEEMLSKQQNIFQEIHCDNEPVEDNLTNQPNSPTHFFKEKNSSVNFEFSNSLNLPERKEEITSGYTSTKRKESSNFGNCSITEEKGKRLKVCVEGTSSNWISPERHNKPILKKTFSGNSCKDLKTDISIDLDFDEISNIETQKPLSVKENHGFQFILNAAKARI